jgi:hypothetical protein
VPNGAFEGSVASNGRDETREARRPAVSMRTQVELLRRVVFDLIDEAIHLGDPDGTDITDALQSAANELGVVEARLCSVERAPDALRLVHVA